MFTDTALNRMIGALGATHIAVWDGEPGQAGAAELDRQAISWNPAAGGNLDSADQPQLALGAGETARFLAYYDQAVGGNLLAYHPKRAAGHRSRAFTVDPGADRITCAEHGFADGDAIIFFFDAAPTGLTRGQVYYAINVTADTFQVAAAPEGDAIDITGAAGANCRVSRIIPETFGEAGTLTLTDADLSIANES